MAKKKTTTKTKATTRRARPSADQTATRTKGEFLRKQIYLRPDEWNKLRERAFDEERSHSDIVREALRKYLSGGRRYWEEFLADLASDGIAHIDTTMVLARFAEEQGLDAAFVGGGHYSTAASKVVAEEVLARLGEL